ncbi:hypothetical protein D1007_46693 [Hordeum vulgare]|nr:hypothetical protein D1007_46693 [Hordeum vulgare]
MANARRVRAERRVTSIAHTAPIGAVGARRSPSPVGNASTSPEVQEEQGSSEPVDDQTATPSLARPSGSASHAGKEMPHGRRALSMATELLRYWLALDRHEDWLHRIEELIAAAGDSAALSCSLRPQSYLANKEEQDVPPPPLRRVADTKPGQETRSHARPREPKTGPGDEATAR